MTSRTITQRNQILAHLRSHPITPLEALECYGCFRLGARIFELREQGFHITKEMVETEGGARVAKYRLVGQMELLA